MLVDVLLVLGEDVEVAGRRVRVARRDLDCLPRVRAHLLDVARAEQTTTYGDLVRELDLPYPPRGLGRLLRLLTEDCSRRGEPSLAAVVVSRTTGEITGSCVPDPVAERAALHRHWS